MKKFNNIPNKPYVSVEDGKVRYHSRSVAVLATVILSNGQGEYSVLVHKRGQKCPDEKGKWSFNCGYLDWNETLENAVKRELWEEMGLDVDSLGTCKIVRTGEIDDSITGENQEKQNITIRYLVICDLTEITWYLESEVINPKSDTRGGEPEEVEEIKIMSLSEKIDPSEWAFNHGEIFINLHKHYYGD